MLGQLAQGWSPHPTTWRPAPPEGRRLLTGWKAGGCRMKGSGSGSRFSAGDMGGGHLQRELLVPIPGARPLADSLAPGGGSSCWS